MIFNVLKFPAGINKEDIGVRLFDSTSTLVKDDNSSRNTGAKEKSGRKANHGFDGRTLPALDPAEIDAKIVSTQNDGLQEVFIGEKRWYQIRMHSSIIPRIKHIAAYRVAPTSAITHVAEVASIKPWPNSNKYVLNFVGHAREIGPLKLVTNGAVRAPQGSRYTSLSRLEVASNLDEAFDR